MKEQTLYHIVESPVHSKEVLLAFTPGSSNIKTGDMAQIYILHPDAQPLEISKQGLDDRICGGCPLRHSLGGSCYVTLFMGPRGAYMGWENSGKRVDDIPDILSMLKDKHVRFGAYGDPAHIPAWLATEIMAGAEGWTAYTHAWRNPVVAQTWKGKAMASCETAGQLRLAESQGWKCFIATTEDIAGVPTCLNEVNETKCYDCLRCDGHHSSFRITPHGARAGKHPGNKKK